MIGENSVTYLYIGNKSRNGVTDILKLPEGAVALTKADNEREIVTSGSANETLQVAQKVNGQLVYSPVFVPNDFTVSRNEHEDAKEQITFVGYNGTEGNLDEDEDDKGTTFNLSLRMSHTQGMYNNTPMIKSVPYRLLSGDDNEERQSNLAKGLTESFTRQFRRDPDQLLRCERTADGTDATITAASDGNLIKVTKGSKKVTVHSCTDGADIADAGNVTFSAGDVIKIPTINGREFKFSPATDDDHLIVIGEQSVAVEIGTVGATDTAEAIRDAINDDSYLGERVIASVDTSDDVIITYRPGFYALPPVVLGDTAGGGLEVTTETGNDQRGAYIIPSAHTDDTEFELDTPWATEGGYVSIASGDDRNNDACDVSDQSNWGLMLTGQTPTEVDAVTDFPFMVSFKVSFYKSGSEEPSEADITYEQSSSYGVGNYRVLASKEVYTTMNDGNPVVSGYPPTKYRRKAEKFRQYDVFTIKGVDAGYTSAATGIKPISTYNILIAVEQDDAGDIEDILGI